MFWSFLGIQTNFSSGPFQVTSTIYPLLNSSGILIIDDYGHWQGAKKAVDEFFKDSQIFLHRIDYTARLIVKPVGEQGRGANA